MVPHFPFPHSRLTRSQTAGCIDSIVPITHAHGRSLQEAVDAAVAALQASKNRFEVAADLLRADAARTTRAAKAMQHVEAFVHANRKYCVGNLTWSLATGRYGMAGLAGEDGEGKIWMTL